MGGSEGGSISPAIHYTQNYSLSNEPRRGHVSTMVTLTDDYQTSASKQASKLRSPEHTLNQIKYFEFDVRCIHSNILNILNHLYPETLLKPRIALLIQIRGLPASYAKAD